MTVTTSTNSNAAPGPMGPMQVRPPGVMRRLPPVFSAATFLIALAGLFAAPVVVALGQILLADRLGLSAGLATGLAVMGGALVAVAGGLLAAIVGRRIGFFEIATATLALAGGLLLVALRLTRFQSVSPLIAAWQAQGGLVVGLGFTFTAVLSGTFTFAGASAGYLLFGSGRFDPSLSYELFIAKSHLRLTPRTLLGLFLWVVTGIVPGMLVAAVWSFRRERRERRALLQGESAFRPRMPATLLMTLISIGGVAIGVWALTVVLSVMSGFEGDLKAKILGTNSHGIVMKYGQNDFTEWQHVRRDVLAVKEVVGATPFLYNEVMLSAQQNLTGAIVKGIDPATVGTVTNLPRDVLPGEGRLEDLDDPRKIPTVGIGDRMAALLDEQDAGGKKKAPAAAEARPSAGAGAGRASEERVLPGIAIGREMARALRVGVGDVVNLISPLGDLGPAGPQPKSRPFRVAAVLFTGMYEYDSKFAYIQLGEAQRFFGVGDAVTGLELKVRNVDDAPATLRKVLTALGGYPYRGRDWGQLNRNLFSALMMEKVVMAVILGFIVLVASFIIVATLIMQVLDKRREIAVLKSMGAGQPSVMKIFVAEGVIIGAVGTVFGLLLGFGTCLLVQKVGIPLDPEVYYISNLPVRMDQTEFAMVALLAVALSYLATIYPASKASRLEPVEGLRSE